MKIHDFLNRQCWWS